MGPAALVAHRTLPGVTDLPTDPAELRELLRIRLAPAPAPDEPAPQDSPEATTTELPPTRREVLPGVHAELVVACETGIEPLSLPMATALARDLDDHRDDILDDHRDDILDDHRDDILDDPLATLWDLAAEQVRANHYPDIDVEEPAPGMPVMVLTSDSPFGATHAMWADHFLDTPDDGLLVIAPHRGLVLVHAVRDAAVQAALPNLALLARHHFEHGEAPVSPWLYWWHDATFHRIEVQANEAGDELAIGVPQELQDRLPALLATR